MKRTHSEKNIWEMGLSSPKLKKLITFQEKTCNAWKSKISYISFQIKAQKKKVSYTFRYKEAKIFKLKYILIIIIMRFFSFCNIFSYTQQAYFFHLLRDFCNVHDHIIDFFSFLRKISISFIVFLYFFDNT